MSTILHDMTFEWQPDATMKERIINKELKETLQRQKWILCWWGGRGGGGAQDTSTSQVMLLKSQEFWNNLSRYESCRSIPCNCIS